MGHPDFRVDGRIFATLGHPRAGWGMLKLSPEDQEFLIRAYPDIFVPVNGAWGKAGCTNLQLRKAPAGVVREALTFAWRTRRTKTLAARYPVE